MGKIKFIKEVIKSNIENRCVKKMKLIYLASIITLPIALTQIYLDPKEIRKCIRKKCNTFRPNKSTCRTCRQTCRKNLSLTGKSRENSIQNCIQSTNGCAEACKFTSFDERYNFKKCKAECQGEEFNRLEACDYIECWTTKCQALLPDDCGSCKNNCYNLFDPETQIRYKSKDIRQCMIDNNCSKDDMKCVLPTQKEQNIYRKCWKTCAEENRPSGIETSDVSEDDSKVFIK